MLDVDTFLTTLYVMVDDFCHSRPQKQRLSGPDASLSPSEVVTLAIFSRWSRFSSERDFYRYAKGYLQGRFPYPAQPLAVQPVGTLAGEAHRGGGLASGHGDGGSELSLPSPGQLGYAC